MPMLTSRVRAALVVTAAVSALSGCMNQPAYTWGGGAGVAYSFACPTCYTRVSRAGAAYAAVATGNGLTSVSSSAGGAGSTVATDGTNTAVAASAGSAHAAVGVAGSSSGISTSAGNASASTSTNGTSAGGSTSAGNASSTW